MGAHSYGSLIIYRGTDETVNILKNNRNHVSHCQKKNTNIERKKHSVNPMYLTGKDVNSVNSWFLISRN